MSLTLLDALSVPLGDVGTVRERVEAAHARLHKSRCRAWMAATGNFPSDPYSILAGGEGPVRTIRRDHMPKGRGCDLHPVEPGDL